MSKMQTNNIPVQGTEVVTEKKRKISTSATITSFRKMIKTLSEAKMATDEELKPLKELFNKVYDRWMGEEMKF